MSIRARKVLALSGGVGGAKLALGLSHVLDGTLLTIIANTGDDFEHLGLSISPDLDTLMYTLAGINNREQGWGIADETWQVSNALIQMGEEAWFQLGDRDIATHLSRTSQLREGNTLSQITKNLCRNLGITARLLPMSDDPVRTVVESEAGRLAFQHYFVRERCAPRVTGFHLDGIHVAQPQSEFLALLQDPALDVVIICPSNPFVSVAPILGLPGVKEAMGISSAPVIAVSPIVAGAAIKGPTAKMMKELNMPTTALAIAEYYGDQLDGFVIDQSDEEQRDAIRDLGIEVLVAPTVMHGLEDKVELASRVLQFAYDIRANAPQV